MVETHEIAEKIHGQHHAHTAAEDETFRRWCGIYLGVVAMLLAIASLGGSSTTKEMLNANIHASDTYAFYQAKNIRQTAYQLAADQLETLLAASPGLPDDAKSRTAEAIRRYRATAARYESDPAQNDGKKELMAKAREWEARRDKAVERDPNFEFAEAFFQIAIVLGSVSIVAASRPLLFLSGGLAILAGFLTLNGFFLLTHLPFH